MVLHPDVEGHRITSMFLPRTAFNHVEVREDRFGGSILACNPACIESRPQARITAAISQKYLVVCHAGLVRENYHQGSNARWRQVSKKGRVKAGGRRFPLPDGAFRHLGAKHCTARPWHYHIAPDSVCRTLVSDRVHKPDLRCFDGPIIGVSQAAKHTRSRRDDDHASATVRSHMAKGRLHDGDHTAYVNVEQVAETFQRGVDKFGRRHISGRCYHRIQPSPGVERRRDGGISSCDGSHAIFARDRRAARCLDFIHHRPGSAAACRDADIVYDESRAAPGKFNGSRTANSASSTCNDDDLTVKAQHVPLRSHLTLFAQAQSACSSHIAPPPSRPYTIKNRKSLGRMMMQYFASANDALLARQSIHDALIRYAHGLDRQDWDWFASAFWPNAIDDHGTYLGPIGPYLEHVRQHIPPNMLTAHTITNVTIEFLSAACAISECYVTARHGELGIGHREIVTIGGRYVDRMERRGQEWRIAYRTFVLEWHDSPTGTEELMPASVSRRRRGARGAADVWEESRRAALEILHNTGAERS